MYIPNPYFKNVPQIGNLILDYIFIEDGYPVLFTCLGDKGLYLCLCYDTRNEQKWIISPINNAILKQLVFDEISIYSALKHHSGCAYIAIWKFGSNYENYTCVSCQELDDDDLPDADVFLEDDDSKQYYDIVKNRTIQNDYILIEKITSINNNKPVNYQCSIYYEDTIKSACPNIDIFTNSAKLNIEKFNVVSMDNKFINLNITTMNLGTTYECVFNEHINIAA